MSTIIRPDPPLRPRRDMAPAAPPETPYPITPREVMNRPGICSVSTGSREDCIDRSIDCRSIVVTVIGTVAGSGDDHLVDGVRALHVERIGSGDLLGRCCHGREAQCQGQIYAFAHCVYIDMFSAGRQRRMLSAAK